MRSRLTDVVPFTSFSALDIRAAVRLYLADEARSFAKASEFLHVSLLWEPEVVGALSAEYLKRPEEGLRGVHMQLQALVRAALESAIDSGLVEKHGGVVLRLQPNVDNPRTPLDLRVLPPSRYLDGYVKTTGGSHDHKESWVSSIAAGVHVATSANSIVAPLAASMRILSHLDFFLVVCIIVIIILFMPTTIRLCKLLHAGCVLIFGLSMCSLQLFFRREDSACTEHASELGKDELSCKMCPSNEEKKGDRFLKPRKFTDDEDSMSGHGSDMSLS